MFKADRGIQTGDEKAGREEFEAQTQREKKDDGKRYLTDRLQSSEKSFKVV